MRILLLEDNPVDVELIEYELRQSLPDFVMKWVVTEEDFTKELLEYCPDIVLSDYDLPRYNGALALAETRKQCPDVPFILVTGAVTEDRAIEILTSGAKDYVLKTRLQQRLVPAVQRALAEAGEHQARKRAEDELRETYRILEKQVEERTSELQENKERLNLALISSGMGAFEWDIVNNRRYFDDYVYLLLNIKPEDFSGTSEEFFKVIHPDDRHAVQDALDKAIEQDAPYETQYRAIWPDGSIHHISARGKVQRDATGRPLRMLGVCWEITERKRADEELRESQALLHAITESSPDPIFVKDLQSRIIFGNSALLRVWGKSLEDVVGRNDRELYDDPAIGEAIMANDRLVMESGGSRAVEEVVLTPEGLRTYLSTKTPYRNGSGEIIGILGIARDITERKRIEEDRERLLAELENRAAELDATISSMAVGLIVYNMAGKAVRMSNVVEKLFPAEIFFNTTVAERLHVLRWETEEGQSFLLEQIPVARALRGETTSNVVMAVPFPDRKLWISASAAPIRTPDGHMLGAVTSFIDITERKQAEEDLKKSEELLRATNKELESFSYTVSHDLQAPLRAIRGFSDMIMKDGAATGAETKRKLAVIQDNAERMQQLIDDLLALSRVGRQGVSSKLIDMNALVKDVWEELKAAYHGKHLILKIKDLLPAYGDQNLIRQVLANLLSNAIKFSANRKRIVVDVGSNQKNGGNVYYVKDKGVGFDMQHYDKLFGVFQRLHSSSEFKGTGIGLSIAQRIVHLHGGQIWAESEIDEGAIFYFLLPGSLSERDHNTIQKG